MSAIVLGAARHTSMLQTLLLDRISPGASRIITALIQSSDHGKTINNEEGSREGQSKDLVRVQNGIVAHEGAVGSRESSLPFYTQTTLSTRSGPGCQLEEHAHHLNRGAPNRAKAGGRLS